MTEKTDPATVGAGLHYGLSFDAYRAVDAANASLLKQRTPAHMKAYLDGLLGKGATPAMVLGSLTHAMLFEPDTIDRDYAFAAVKDKKQAAWKAHVKANPDKQCLTETDRAHADEMVAAVRKDPVAQGYLEATGPAELTAIARDEDTGILCKGRFDKYIAPCEDPPIGIIPDYKTTTNAEEWAWRNKCKEFDHPFSAAFYIRLAEAITGCLHRFVWIVQETTPPYAVQCYYLEDESQAKGIERIDAALRNYKEGIETGNWPGYGGGLKAGGYPAWMLKQHE